VCWQSVVTDDQVDQPLDRMVQVQYRVQPCRSARRPTSLQAVFIRGQEGHAARILAGLWVRPTFHAPTCVDRKRFFECMFKFKSHAVYMNFIKATFGIVLLLVYLTVL